MRIVSSSLNGPPYPISPASTTVSRGGRQQQYASRSLAFLHQPSTSVINFPTLRHKCLSVCRLPHIQTGSPSSQITRRQVLRVVSFISLYSIPRSCIAQTDDETTFIKLPCDVDGCRPIEIHDYRLGTGKTAENGCRITVKWTGRLADRYGWPIQKEDADPVSFLLGTDKLIRGFEIGIQGMREGGKRRLIIPAEMGYKDEKSGPLPASYGDRRRLFATVLNPRRFKRAGDLVIDLQLLKVRSPR